MLSYEYEVKDNYKRLKSNFVIPDHANLYWDWSDRLSQYSILIWNNYSGNWTFILKIQISFSDISDVIEADSAIIGDYW